VLLLSEFCSRVEDIVNNCTPDLRSTSDSSQEPRILRWGLRRSLSEFLRRKTARLRARLGNADRPRGRDRRVVFFLPDPGLLESLVMALGKYRDFEIDNVFFSLRRKEGFPLGIFGQLKVGEKCPVHLYAFPYLRSVSPLWYTLAPAPIGIVVFLKDEMTGSLESLMSVSDYIRGTSSRVALAVMGKAFSDFGLGENTLRLFRNRVERLGCSLKVREMEQMTAGEIRDSLASVIQQFLEGEPA
jgi:hypothetical protein